MQVLLVRVDHQNTDVKTDSNTVHAFKVFINIYHRKTKKSLKIGIYPLFRKYPSRKPFEFLTKFQRESMPEESKSRQIFRLRKISNKKKEETE